MAVVVVVVELRICGSSKRCQWPQMSYIMHNIGEGACQASEDACQAGNSLDPRLLDPRVYTQFPVLKM